jgi:hypothetical protein
MNNDYEELVLWIVLDKPSVNEITHKLATLADEYKSAGIDALYEKVKSFFIR